MSPIFDVRCVHRPNSTKYCFKILDVGSGEGACLADVIVEKKTFDDVTLLTLHFNVITSDINSEVKMFD